ncbi:carbohydrate ABC transporter permease [Ruania alba]|uniref:Carbohydrate ABC transporter membrane protein 2, CUT1 family n=1 Tax=Ruania alba TaxID=648782 RepID=A0A1H5H0C0_9MICO|nr:carbohydrate ABC transporter permease [Ruania alba]SEE20728.1 carbohydrate ABC transporter membrane protein 2, CUT1 family [Ruania alba]
MHTTSPALRRAWTVALTVAMLAIGLAMIFPIVWSILTAFKPNAEAASASPMLLPQTWTLENFSEIWSAIPFAQLYGNTIIFAGSVMVLSLAFDTMAGYALARFDFRGKTAAFIAIIVMLMIPYQAVIIPLYDLVHSLGLGQTVAGMIVPRSANAFGVFFMRQFFLALPKNLEEAARIDGASEWRIFTRVMLPLTTPALLTLGLFHFQFNWNDLLWPLVMSNSIDGATLPAGLALFAGQHVVEYGLLMAGSVLALIPLILFFLLIQRTFVTGIATTGIK